MSISPARALLALAVLATIGACVDRPLPLDPRAPDDDPRPAALASLSCTADMGSGVVSCSSDPGPSGGASRLLVGGQGVYVRMASSNPRYADGVFTFDATVQNLIPQTLGVGADGEPDGNGVSVVFWQEPVATEGTGEITINGALTGMFFGSGERFYRYDQTLAKDQTSDSRQWSFNVPPTVVRFGFTVYVAASVQHPDGWIDITGAPDLHVARHGTLALSAVVRSAVGDVVASADPVTWSLADTTVAAITGSTLTGAGLSGYTTLHAVSSTRSGAVRLLVGTPFTRMSAGIYHTCGLGPTGQTYCWGLAGDGQLGDGRVPGSGQANEPVAVQQGSSRFVDVAVGEFHTCALTAQGQAYCWGQNTHGQLGDGTAESRPTPVAVNQDGIPYIQITSGLHHTCALSSSGQMYCWGSGFRGQLGNGTTTDHLTPWPVQQGSSTYVEIDAGGIHTCARSADGQAYCWGYNADGTLGDGGTTQRNAPAAVHQSTVAYVQIAAGVNVTCGRTEPGLVYCWGDNDHGQVGDGTTTDRATPAAVQQGTARYAEIETGWGHTCARSETGQGACWGGNWNGQLGDGLWDSRSTPAAVQQGSWMYRQIIVGGQHSCGLSAAGQAFCWGNNRSGQLGDGTTTVRPTPVPVK